MTLIMFLVWLWWQTLGGPFRAIWLCVGIAFLLGLPGLVNQTVRLPPVAVS
jgi:hypothetical protein